MNKFGIRVVKRNDIAVASKIKAVSAAKIENVIRHERVDAVNEWVTDRRESIRLEKVFSDGKILAWKMVSVNLKETLN